MKQFTSVEKTLRSGEKIVIRLLKEEDLQGIAVLNNQAELNKYAPFNCSKLEYEKEMYKSIYSQDNCYVLVAELNRKIVGSVILQYDYGKKMHIANLFVLVHKDFQNKGIGKLLMRTFFDLAKRLKMEKIEIEVYSDNSKAISFYKKFGFIQEGIRKKGIKRKNKYVDRIQMAKFIN